MAATPPSEVARDTTLMDLSDDLLVSLFPCKADRARLSLVCKAWRKAFDRIRLSARGPPPLPWLLLPSPIPGDGSTRAACCVLSGCRVHHGLTITPPGARCLGSHDGGWLFLEYSGRDFGYQLRNVRTRDACVLPTALRRWKDPDVKPMGILAATLSSSPDDANCIVGAIVVSLLQRCPAFWRMGYPQAIEMQPDQNHVQQHVTDLVYHDGAFRFLLADVAPYPCNDNGKWLPEVGIQRCFPRTEPTYCSPPAWLLP